MRRLRDTFTRSIAWTAGRILTALVLAAALAYFGIGKAQAQTTQCETLTVYNTTCPDQGRAHAIITEVAITRRAALGSMYVTSLTIGPIVTITNGYKVSLLQSNGTAYDTVYRYYPAGATCSTRTNLSAGYIRGSSDTVCKDGCQYKAPSGTGVVKINFGAAGEGWTQSVSGSQATGMVCVTNTEQPSNEEDCLAIEGQSVCKRADGKLCYSASTGRRICWSSGETGQKTDGSLVQVSNIGQTPLSPNLGEPTQPTGQTPITTTTTTTTNNTVTNTTTVTTSNHTTTSGAPAGGSNQGEAADGSGTGTGGGTEGGEGTDMTATNGLLGEIKGLLGSEGTADATFEGQIDGAFAGENDVPDNDEHADPTDGIKQVRDGNWLTDQLDDSGFLGGGQCPADVQVNVGTASIPLTFGPICQLLSAISGLVMAASYLLAFRIITA